MICIKCGESVPDGLYCIKCGQNQTAPVRSPKRRGNGTGTAFRRGRYWYAQTTTFAYIKDEDGIRHKVRRRLTKGGFTTKKDALAYLSTMSPEGKRIPTVAELWSQFEDNDLPKLSKDKQYAYKRAAKHIEGLMPRQIDGLTVAELQNAVNDKASTYYTARDIKNLLSKLYQKAMPDQFVSQNLARFVTLPEQEPTAQEPFTADEVSKMWTAFADGEVFVGYLILMIYSGMMPGELFDCRTDMIDLERCEIYGCGKKTKTRKDAPIVFADVVKPVVVELIANADGLKLYGKHPTTFYDEYHATLKALGIRDLPPYSCRHTTGTAAAKQNLNAATIQKIMRHSKIATSQHYIHLGNEDAHRGINAISPGGTTVQ